MKARRKGDAAPFEDVYQIVIGRGLNAKYIPINDVEFEQDRWQEPCKLNPEKDLSNPIDHWQDIRERAAIAALQGLLSAPLIEDVNLNSSVKEITNLSVILANALVKKLKGE